MYTILLDGEMFFDPRIDGYPLGAPKLVREANKIGTLSFTIYPPHPAYGNISMLTSGFSVLKDGMLIYRGRPAYSKRTFKGAIEYKCEEITSIMNDFQFRPTQITGGADELFRQVVASINNRSSVQFALGTVMNPGNIDIKTEYMGHWDVLQKYLVSEFGGYIFPTYENNTVTLNWMREEDLPESEQVIRFGENMTDMFIEMDSQETFSGIIPIGGKPEGQDEKIDITSVNSGQDVIYNADAMDLYGQREIMKEWADITDPQELMDTGNAWIRENAIKFRQSVQISAIDLHNANYGIESFSYMHRVKAESTRHGLSERYLLSREEVPLDRPTGTKLTLGSTRRTFSDSLKEGTT